MRRLALLSIAPRIARVDNDCSSDALIWDRFSSWRPFTALG